MPTVPRINEDEPINISLTMIRVNELSRKVLWSKRAPQKIPTRMKGFQKRKRNLNRCGTQIGQLSPLVFGIRFDRRRRLRESQFQPHVRIEMAVWHVVNDLADGPPAVSIRSIELRFIQS